MTAKNVAIFVATALPIVLSSGCGKSALPPPVRVTYRDSLFGIGRVVQITNTSSHHLYNVKVTGRNLNKMESASVKVSDHLAPSGFVEVGWYEFGRWVPEVGETIEIYVDDYAMPHISVIPNK